MTIDAYVGAKSGAEIISSKLTEVGYVIVLDAIDDQMHADLISEIAPHLESADPNDPRFAELGNVVQDQLGMADGVFLPGQTKRITGLLDKSDSYGRLIVQPCLKDVSTRILRDGCDMIQLHSSASMSVGPGAQSQVLHREEDSFPHYAFPRPPLIVASMMALTDFTEENGATRVVPGSHLWDDERRAVALETVSAEMPARSILLWMGRTLHGAGANRTEAQWRTGVFTSFSLGWLRQEENQYLQLRPEKMTRLSREVSDLAGFGTYSASLGHYEGAMEQFG